MSGPVGEAYPNIAEWMGRGYIEVGYDGCSKSFIRVLDIGGMIREGEKSYDTVNDALAEADPTIVEWFTENRR